MQPSTEPAQLLTPQRILIESADPDAPPVDLLSYFSERNVPRDMVHDLHLHHARINSLDFSLFPNLSTLCIQNCCFDNNHFMLAGTSVRKFSFTDKSWTNIDEVNGCDNLEELVINTPNVSDYFKLPPNILRFTGHELLPRYVKDVAETCPKLESLTLVNCTEIKSLNIDALNGLDNLAKIEILLPNLATPPAYGQVTCPVFIDYYP